MLEFLEMCVVIGLLIAPIGSLFVLFVVGYMMVKEDKAHGKNLPGRLP
jgi:hypothetical protein